MLTIKKAKNSYSRFYAEHTYLTQLKQFFLKKGGKSKMENLFKQYMICPPVKDNLKPEGWSKKTQEKFIKCEQNSTPYVKLKIRKRGKRIKYRVTFLEKKYWLKKALLPFSKVVREKKMDRFLISFDKELENLSAGRSTVMLKRDEFHKLSLSKAPYAWKRKRNKKNLGKSKASMIFIRLAKKSIEVNSEAYSIRTLEKTSLETALKTSRKTRNLRAINALKFRLKLLGVCYDQEFWTGIRLAKQKRQLQEHFKREKEKAKEEKNSIKGNK